MELKLPAELRDNIFVSAYPTHNKDDGMSTLK